MGPLRVPQDWFESLLLAHVLCELLEDPEVVLPTGFGR